MAVMAGVVVVQLYVVYQTAIMLMTWKVTFAVLITICLGINRKAYMACNLNCLVKIERFINVVGNHVHCRCGNISESVQDSGITTDHTNRKSMK